MPFLKIKKSGTLVRGYFYVLWAGNPPDATYAQAHGWPLVRPARMHEGYLPYVADNVVHKGEDLHECPISPQHVTGGIVKEFSLLVCGDYFAPVIPYSQWFLVTEKTARSLEASGLSGIEFIRATSVGTQSQTLGQAVFTLRGTGKARLRPPVIVPDSANFCTSCNYGPIVCQWCGYEYYDCPQCNKRCVITPDESTGPDDTRIVDRRERGFPPIVEPESWNGKDFCSEGGLPLVTHRAVEYLMAIRAGPSYAEPCLVDLAALDEEQRERLERIKKPIV